MGGQCEASSTSGSNALERSGNPLERSGSSPGDGTLRSPIAEYREEKRDCYADVS